MGRLVEPEDVKSALREAARTAWKRAAAHGLTVPVAKDGKIIQLDPNELLTQDAAQTQTEKV